MNKTRRQVLQAFLFAPALSLLSSCGSSFEDPIVGGDVSTPPRTPNVGVIFAEEAARLILSQRVLVLAAESKAESRPLQLLGGAVPVNVDQLTEFSEQPGTLLDAVAFGQLFRSWGVDSTTPIVVYDDGAAKFAARVHFLLLHFGAASSFIVNGGDRELTNFVAEATVPTMVMSYEKSLQEPRQFVEALARFCGKSPTDDVLDRAVQSIENGPVAYLNASRVRYEGRLDKVRDGVAEGWARNIGYSAPVTVVITAQQKVVGRGIAGLFRDDLQKAGKGDGKCAFRIKISQSDLSKDDVIAKIEGTRFTLEKSAPRRST